jgi:hypothetical protein
LIRGFEQLAWRRKESHLARAVIPL